MVGPFVDFEKVNHITLENEVCYVDSYDVCTPLQKVEHAIWTYVYVTYMGDTMGPTLDDH